DVSDRDARCASVFHRGREERRSRRLARGRTDAARAPQQSPAIRHHLVRARRSPYRDLWLLRAELLPAGTDLTFKTLLFLCAGAPPLTVGSRPKPPPLAKRPVLKFVSTRGQAPALSFEGALLAALARDGGLYMPEAWPKLSPDAIAGLAGLDYADAAYRVMRP